MRTSSFPSIVSLHHLTGIIASRMIMQLGILVINYLGVGLRKMANIANQLQIEA